MKKILILLILSICAFAKTDIIIYSECNNPPYSSCKDGKVGGISVDIYNAIFNKIEDYSLEVKGVYLDEALEKMKNKEIKILGTIPHNPIDRPYITDYTDSFIDRGKSLFCIKDINISDKSAFDGLIVLGTEGGYLDSDTQEFITKHNIKLQDGNISSNIIALLEERADCYIENELTLRGETLKIQKDYKDKNISITITEFDKIKKLVGLSEAGYYIGFSDAYFPLKNDLIKKINLAIKVMKNNGEIDEIIKHYMGTFLDFKGRDKLSVVIYPLASLVSKKMEGYGILSEIVSKAFANRHIDVNYRFEDRKYAYLLNKWGKDCVTFPWIKEKDLESYSYISDPLIIFDINFFYLKENFENGIKYEEFDDLKKYRVGGIKGSFYEALFQQIGFEYTSFSNNEELIKAMLLNQIDITPANKYIFRDALVDFVPYKIDSFIYHPKKFLRQIGYVLFSRMCENSEHYKDEFNRGFINIQNDGTLQKIVEKYASDEDKKKEYSEFFKNMETVEQKEKLIISDLNSTDTNASKHIDSNITIDIIEDKKETKTKKKHKK